jgi:hypothetical protein
MKKTERMAKILSGAMAVSIVFSGCPHSIDENNNTNNNGNPIDKPETCNCLPTKQHYLPCDCGKEKCICTVVPRGYISANSTINPNEQIPVYMTNGVTDEEAVAVISNIQDAYDSSLSDANKNDLAGKIKEIRIVNEATSYEISDGKIIIKMGKAETKIAAYLRFVIIPDVIPTLTQIKQQNASYIVAGTGDSHLFSG